MDLDHFALQLATNVRRSCVSIADVNGDWRLAVGNWIVFVHLLQSFGKLNATARAGEPAVVFGADRVADDR